MWGLLSLALLIWQAYCLPQVLNPDSRGSDRPVVEFDGPVRVCYEYVTVITYIGDFPGSLGGYIGTTEAYTGTSVLTGPITTTLPPNGGVPGEVIVLTPTTPVLTPSTTITSAYTGTSVLTGPITTTLPPNGGIPGDVIVLTPTTPVLTPSTTVTSAYTGTSVLLGPTTITIPPIGNIPQQIVVLTPTTPVPTLSMTITVAYTGTSSITDAITTTMPPMGTEPGTVIIQTPPALPPFVTEEEPYTGASSIAEPITTTIPASGTEPGTVIIEIPPSQSSTSGGAPVLSMEPPSSTVPEPPSTTSPPASGPTYNCNTGGFLMQGNSLYRLDLETGENRLIKGPVGPGGNIHGIGYNSLDNFIYGMVIVGNQDQLIRIDSNGDSTLLPLFVEPATINVGDIDDQGQYWISAGGARWYQIDLRPGSPTFGTIVNNGTSSGATVSDWVYLKNGGDYLYAVNVGSPRAIAARWSRTTHTWQTLRDFGNLNGATGFGAFYAVGDELWGSNNGSGDIVAFPVLDTTRPARTVSSGDPSSVNDGARCLNAPPLGAAAKL